MTIHRNLWLSVSEKTVGCGYHYCVSGITAVTAYRTAQGFKNYLKRTGLKLQFIDEWDDNRGGGHLKSYGLIGEYQELSFWNIEEIPRDAKHFKGLSNGSYVDCYYAIVDGLHTIYRPNPNAKSVYTPSSTEEHRYLASIN